MTIISAFRAALSPRRRALAAVAPTLMQLPSCMSLPLRLRVDWHVQTDYANEAIPPMPKGFSVQLGNGERQESWIRCRIRAPPRLVIQLLMMQRSLPTYSRETIE
ncbi:hypothetical protein AMATHDRAFT_66394 [Amanita thiersii Skay4041]|uniref:Uncharacterized protein n=1 Tax=Amanita thiersii Skay4041 TaxID=703135 RepID=A0A2A9NI73_9AGAR|nr:hypothetical protein AMATHDRAFT_66394 [Amanita thiersii Skay4041]